MNKITQLTKKQEGLMPRYREKYLGIGLSTRNLPKKIQIKIINELYEFLGHRKPKIVFCESPDAIITRNNQIGLEDFWWGNMYAPWVSSYAFVCEQLNIDYSKHKFKILKRITRLGVIAPFETTCYVSAKPVVIHFNGNKKLHCESGPAIEFSDGFSIYSWNGIRLDRDTIMYPEKISIEQINNEGNAEKRRCLIEIIGYERYLRETNAKLIDTKNVNNQIYKLYEADFGYTKAKIVELINSTAENDGTYKKYFFRVSKKITDAHEAVASLYGLSKNDYTPEVET